MKRLHLLICICVVCVVCIVFLAKNYTTIKTSTSPVIHQVATHDIEGDISNTSISLFETDWNGRELTLHDIHNIIWRQIHFLQEESNCESKKILFCENVGNYAGLGSMAHRFGVCMQMAFGLGRIWFINQPEYEHFGGLSQFLQFESKKCNYLKEKYKNAEHCDIQHAKHYPNGQDIDNKCKVYHYHSQSDFPHPRQVPTTLPVQIEKALVRLKVEKPWLWFTSQFLGYLFLRPNDALAKKIAAAKNSMNIQHPYVALHIRRGDKISSGESRLVHEKLFIQKGNEFLQYGANSTHRKTFYVASDDVTIKDRLTSNEFDIKTLPKYLRTQGSYFQRHFPKGIFETLLVDLHFLVYSNFTVCTFSSNIGRLVYELKHAIPPYVAQNHTVSLDFPFEVVYLWNGYADYWIRSWWVTVNSNPQKKQFGKHGVIDYRPGVLVAHTNQIIPVVDNGQNRELVFVYTKHGNIPTHVFKEDIVKWPGRPKYYFYK